MHSQGECSFSIVEKNAGRCIKLQLRSQLCVRGGGGGGTTVMQHPLIPEASIQIWTFCMYDPHWKGLVTY